MTNVQPALQLESDAPLELDPQAMRLQGIEPYSQPVIEPTDEAAPTEPLLIDVSRYQGQIDFAKLATNEPPNQVRAVISRATVGTLYGDPTFRHNLDGAMTHIGIAGAYLVIHPDSDAKRHVDNFLRHTGGKYGNLPVAVDVELALGQSASKVTDVVVAVLEHLRQATGKLPFIYTANWFWGPNVLHTPSIWEAYKHRLWVAHYNGFLKPALPAPWSSWTDAGHLIHQYSDKGRLLGITANTVDLNRLNGTFALLQQLASVTQDGEEETEETPLQALEKRVATLEQRVATLEGAAPE